MEMIEKDKEYLGKEEYDEMKSAMDKAQESTDPFLVVDGNGENLSVIGDANKTEKKVNSYDVLFRFPNFMELDNNVSENVEILQEQEIGNYIYRNIRFKNVFISPRHDLDVVRAIDLLLPFFYKLQEDGGVEDLSDDEALSIIANMNSEMIDAMYNVVCVFLGLNGDYREFITINSAFEIFLELIKDYPAVFNEADVFFG